MRKLLRAIPAFLLLSAACAGRESATTDSAVAADTSTTPATDTTAPAPATTAPMPATISPQAAIKTQPVVPAAKSATPRPIRDDAATLAARADSLRLAKDLEASRVADSVKKAAAAAAQRVVPSAPAPGPDLSAAKVKYDATCRMCHGVAGVPSQAMQTRYPKIAAFDAAFFASHSSDAIVTVLMAGGGSHPKSLKDKLTHDDMVAVAAYIRSFVQK